MTTKYDIDTALWSAEQAALLRRHYTGNELDWENLAEEIEDLGKSQQREVHSRLMRICEHLLKLAYQHRPRPPTSWQLTITEQRIQLANVLEDSPSLRPRTAEWLTKAYAAGRKLAALYTPDLPDECPWTIEQILDSDFWP